MTPPAMRRPATIRREERKSEPVPFASLYAKFEKHDPEVIRRAIDRLIADGNRSIDEFRVAELIGRVPVPPALDKEPVPLHIPGPPNDEVQAAHLARVARQCAPRPADRLREKLARCQGRPALTTAQEAEYRRITRHWAAWDKLPSADWYAAECGG